MPSIGSKCFELQQEVLKRFFSRNILWMFSALQRDNLQVERTNVGHNWENIFIYLFHVSGHLDHFKGSLFLEQFITKFTKEFEKEPKIGPKVKWPKEFKYGEKEYGLIKQSKDRVTYENKKGKGDRLTFGSEKEMTDYLEDYTAPKGGTQSTQLGDTYLSETQLKSLMDSIILK